MKRIPVTGRGGVRAHTLIDDEDAPLVEPWAWHLDAHGYVRRYDRGTKRNLRLHRVILGLTDPAQHGDHINGDRLDNRRRNLRVVTQSENQQNRSSGYGKSRHRGVYWFKGAWCAQATVAGKQKHLGRFPMEEEAAAVAARYRAEHMPFSREFGEREGRTEAA